jgi:membrane protease subunit HflK
VEPGTVGSSADGRSGRDHSQSSRGARQADLERRIGKRRIGKGGFTGRTGLFLILGAVLVWFAWGTFYSVQPNEVGINLVLGRYTGRTAAGLNTNWPWPIGTVIKVPVWDQQIT